MPDMIDSVLDVRREGPVVRLTLNRPEVRNAFNDALVARLHEWARDADARRDARVAVLSGSGPVFCAGADLAWMSGMMAYGREENVRDARALFDMLDALDRLDLPLVGRVQGAALGGGVGLAAVCDVVVAAEDAVFGFTEVRLGIVPAVISPFVLAKIGGSAARELFLTGARFPAARAREIGLVHAVTPPGELDATVDTYVKALLSSGPAAVRTAKQLVREVVGRPPKEVAAMVAATMAALRTSPEGQEGMRAFLERRRPAWRKD
jgi:methylglutaconyl-CoA hydratase